MTNTRKILKEKGWTQRPTPTQHHLEHKSDCPVCKGVSWKICPECNPDIAARPTAQPQEQKV